MGFSIIYKKLFEVNILHDFLLEGIPEAFVKQYQEKYDIHKYLIIEPTDECKKLLKGHKMLFKKTKTGFFVGIEVKEQTVNNEVEFTPYVAFETLLSLNFSVHVKDYTFFNFTNLPQTIAKDDIFLFTNIQKNSTSQPVALSTPIPNFNKSEYYYPGALVTRSNKLWEAKNEKFEQVSFKSTEWKEIARKQYFHPEDKVTPVAQKYKYTFTNGAVKNAHFELFRIDGTKAVEFEIDEDEAIESYELNLMNFPSGTYRLEVNAEGNTDTLEFYWNRDFTLKKPFAVIEIAHIPAKSVQSSECQLLNTATNPNTLWDEKTNRIFNIYFKNRSTYWYYIFSKPQLEADVNNYGDFIPVDDSKTRFISNEIKPLTQIPIEITNFDGETLLPNPDTNNIYPRRIQGHLPDNTFKIYSEIYL